MRKNGVIQSGESEKRGGVRVLFWNVAGLRSKDKEFWDYVCKFDVIGMTETWVEEKGWEMTRKKLPTGGASGGIISGVRKELIRNGESKKMEGALCRKIRVRNKEWDIITIYNKGGKRDWLEKLDNWIEEEKEKEMLIGRDWNTRIGREGSVRELNKGEGRWSEDLVVNGEGKAMLSLVEKRGWMVLNGNKGGDKSGCWTFFRGDSKSVVDYGVTNARSWDEIKDIGIGYRLDSDHQPVIVEMEGEKSFKNERMKEKKKDRWVQCWKEDKVELFRKKEEELEWKVEIGEKKWDELKKGIESCCSKKKIVYKEWGSWFDEQCRRLKKKLKKTSRKEKDGKVLSRLRKKYRELKKKKKEKWEEKMEKELKEIKNEGEAWKFIKKDWKKKSDINEDFNLEQWRTHFMKSLDGAERKPRGLEKGEHNRSLGTYQAKRKKVK
ncbi:Protein of unknown function [Cotesia congregata]|uniref:Endonuclease/exonuclease/phosphatase domain-containing protein n=1 Tax=Cotesia congregata TaxID=51543 RepID=A0A8J2MKU5_COTCN|nr:Protein of unknown function [Cotesia congregata]